MTSFQKMAEARAPLEQLRGYLYAADKPDKDFILHRLADVAEALDALTSPAGCNDTDAVAQGQMEFGH